MIMFHNLHMTRALKVWMIRNLELCGFGFQFSGAHGPMRQTLRRQNSKDQKVGHREMQMWFGAGLCCVATVAVCLVGDALLQNPE